MSGYLRAAYSGIEQPSDNSADYRVRLHANESPQGPASLLEPGQLEKIAGAAFNRYPDPYSVELRRAFAGFFGCGTSESNIACGNGSDELIRVAGEVFLEPGDTVCALVPGFGEYARCARVAKAAFEGVPVTPGNIGDGLGMLARAANASRAKMAFLCNPHNPFGHLWGAREIEEFISSTDCVTVIDEAYIEFSGQESSIPLALESGRVLVLRTMSKAFGAAGLRCGAVVASPAVAGAFLSAKDLYNVNTFTQLTAEALLAKGDQALIRAALAAGERERVASRLEAMGYAPYPSSANFLYMDTPRALDAAREAASCGMLLRVFADGAVRVSIGSPAENDELLRVFGETRP